MNKKLIVIGFMALLLLVPSGFAGYTCDMCGGDGYYWYGGEKHFCFYCDGDGCIENPTPENEWKDDGSCGGGSSSSDNYDEEESTVVGDILNLCWTVGIVFAIFLVIVIIYEKIKYL